MSKLETTPIWLEEIYRLAADAYSAHAMDILMDNFDDLLLSRKFEYVDEVLLILDIDKLSISLMLGFMTVTRPWRCEARLKNRATIVEKMCKAILERAPDRADELLRGLV